MTLRAMAVLAVLVVGLTDASDGYAQDRHLPGSNEIEEKLNLHAQRMEGMLAIEEVKDGHWVVVTALPLPTTFRLSCGSLGLTAYLGPVTDETGAIEISLTNEILTEDQCVDLIKKAEGPLRRLTAAPQSLARSASGAP